MVLGPVRTREYEREGAKHRIIDRMIAWHLLAELGIDLQAFPSAAHCRSWAGLVSGENESAGKQKSSRSRKGNRTLRRAVTQSAWAVSHCKKGYLRPFFHRVKSRRGWAKAIVATSHKLLTIAFQVLNTERQYRELGSDYFDRINRVRSVSKMVERLEGWAIRYGCHQWGRTHKADLHPFSVQVQLTFLA
jgi:transposase